MAEEKEPWLSKLALTTVVFAVAATLSASKGNGFSTQAILSQSNASDQWAFYQAKSIKGSLVNAQVQQGEWSLSGQLDRLSPEQRQAQEKQLGELRQQVGRYDTEKDNIKKEAEAFEKKRDDARLHSAAFSQAGLFLQVAILFSSVAALLKKKPIWLAGVAAGVWGLVNFANGFLLFF